MKIDEIMSLLPHRAPFLMLDRVVELEPGQRAVAIKCVSANEPHFQGHFPGNPIMPGVLIVEAFAQVAGVVALSDNREFGGQTVYLLGMDGMRFRKPVVPGDQLRLEVTKTYEKRRIWKFDAVATVDGQKVASGELMATLADE